MKAKNIILSDEDAFEIVSVIREYDYVHIYLESKQKYCFCPKCNAASTKLHSYYSRTFKDLPMFGNKSTIFLRSRKLYCLNDNCQARIFTERFSEHFFPYKRSTSRLEKAALDLVIEAGGKPSERIAKILGFPISDTTLLRLIEKTKVPLQNTPRVLGVDDWAFKKRDRYGTVLVNLENRKIIDLLPDRKASTLSNWLAKHPEVEIISRDRYGKYIQGATQGAPNAIQVTDRWHLLKNLKEAIAKIMYREYNRLSRIPDPIKSSKLKELNPSLPKNKPIDTKSKQRFLEVKRMQKEGCSIRAIARNLNMHRQTVKKYFGLDELPRKVYKERNVIAYHFKYIKSRMEQEPDILLTTLWKELKERGYTGAYSTLSEALLYYGIRIGKKAKQKNLPKNKLYFFKPSKTAFLFLKDENKLSEMQQNLIQKLCVKSEELATTLTLTRIFKRMMKEKEEGNLDNWIESAIDSNVKEIQSFAMGLKSDYKAVKNAIALSWSNGPVEGNVNKLKTIKRQMYGRGSFQLLKKRLILNTS
ncbi:ISL3 family transposase [bacterium]|nr:ISL3 family transposase [bacterium]